jgi:HAD superfamily hydrolase (TIGR01509 family)
LRARKEKRHRELLRGMEILPGVLDWLDEAERLGLHLAIASSSPSSWVLEHLDAYGLTHRFAHVVCCEDGIERKPAPDCYRVACERLAVEPRAALAVEDSANGVAAAKAAGLWCVAVPNELTRRLDLAAADVQVASLGDITLAEVRARLAVS